MRASPKSIFSTATPNSTTGFVLTCQRVVVLAAALAGEDPDVCGPEFELKDPARRNLTPRSRLEKTPQKHRATVTRGGPLAIMMARGNLVQTGLLPLGASVRQTPASESIH